MKKWIALLLIIVIQTIFYTGCASEEVREPVPEVRNSVPPVLKVNYCTFNQLDGECRYFIDGITLCSMGTCSDGDCQNGKGSMTFPGGSKLEGTFKKGILNGEGAYEGCGESYTGTFKDNLKEKGVLFTKTASKNEREIVQYYDGQFQNEKRNGKGIYYSSRNKNNERDSNIYEGTFKDEAKNGAFVVYLNFTGNFPITKKGAVLNSAYDGLQKISYINDIEKEEYEQAERDRKYKAIQEAKLREEQKKQEARQAQYEREQNVKQQKYEREKDRADQACRATRSDYSPQCIEYRRRY